MDVETIEARIRAAVTKVQANGWKIAPNRTRVDGERRCCLLGAVAVADGLSTEDTSFSEIATRLGVDLDSTSAIADAFDHYELGHYRDYPSENATPDAVVAYALGQRLRAEFVK
jgi:hypothetical protein